MSLGIIRSNRHQRNIRESSVHGVSAIQPYTLACTAPRIPPPKGGCGYTYVSQRGPCDVQRRMMQRAHGPPLPRPDHEPLGGATGLRGIALVARGWRTVGARSAASASASFAMFSWSRYACLLACLLCFARFSWLCLPRKPGKSRNKSR